MKPVISLDPSTVKCWTRKRRELEDAGYIVIVRKGTNPPPLEVITPGTKQHSAAPIADDDGFNLPNEEAA